MIGNIQSRSEIARPQEFYRFVSLGAIEHVRPCVPSAWQSCCTKTPPQTGVGYLRNLRPEVDLKGGPVTHPDSPDGRRVSEEPTPRGRFKGRPSHTTGRV